MIAGASRGLGLAVARALAGEGALVSLSSSQAGAAEEAAQKIAAETGTAAFGMAADVRSAAAIESWHRQTRDRFGGVDLLYVNAGGPPAGSFAALDDAAWQSAFELLVLSAVRLVRTALPSLLERRGAVLLATSSSVKEPIANLTLSNVLRPAVAALAKALAGEYAAQGVRVNHLLPGRIATDRLRQLDELNSRRLGIPLEEQRRRMIANIPLGRYGEPEEFARAAVFLLSDAAAYITGATLQVDGGMIRFGL